MNQPNYERMLEDADREAFCSTLRVLAVGATLALALWLWPFPIF